MLYAEAKYLHAGNDEVILLKRFTDGFNMDIDNNSTRAKGYATENIAANFLCQHGLIEQTRNFHSKKGEIDLIMMDSNTLVFIEVKYRKNNKFGGAISAIPKAKQMKISMCASFYLQQHGLNEYNTSCRFDVICIEGNIHKPEITWLKNAF